MKAALKVRVNAIKIHSACVCAASSREAQIRSVPLAISKALSEGPLNQKYFHNNPNTLLAFFIPLLLQVYGGVSQKLQGLVLQQQIERRSRYENQAVFLLSQTLKRFSKM